MPHIRTESWRACRAWNAFLWSVVQTAYQTCVVSLLKCSVPESLFVCCISSNIIIFCSRETPLCVSPSSYHRINNYVDLVNRFHLMAAWCRCLSYHLLSVRMARSLCWWKNGRIVVNLLSLSIALSVLSFNLDGLIMIYSVVFDALSINSQPFSLNAEC